MSAARIISGSKLICNGGDGGDSHDVCTRATGAASMRERLQELARLERDGVITVEEHIAARKAVLGITATEE